MLESGSISEPVEPKGTLRIFYHDPLHTLLHRTCSACLQQYLPLYHSRHDVRLLGYALAFALVALYLACLAISYADALHWQRMSDLAANAPLLDPGMTWLHTLAKSIGVPAQLPDYFVYAALGSIFLRIFTMQIQTLTLIRRFLYIASSIYLLRAPTIIMTILPTPYNDCPYKRNPNLYLDALLILVQEHQGCGDVFFSGHTIFIMLASRFWLTYSTSRVAHVLNLLLTLFGLVSLLTSAYHYSIDVLYAALLVNAAFSTYHWTVHRKIGRARWWGRVLRWADGEETLGAHEGAARAPAKTSETALPELPGAPSTGVAASARPAPTPTTTRRKSVLQSPTGDAPGKMASSPTLID